MALSKEDIAEFTKAVEARHARQLKPTQKSKTQPQPVYNVSHPTATRIVNSTKLDYAKPNVNPITKMRIGKTPSFLTGKSVQFRSGGEVKLKPNGPWKFLDFELSSDDDEPATEKKHKEVKVNDYESAPRQSGPKSSAQPPQKLISVEESLAEFNKGPEKFPLDFEGKHNIPEPEIGTPAPPKKYTPEEEEVLATGVKQARMVLRAKSLAANLSPEVLEIKRKARATPARTAKSPKKLDLKPDESDSGEEDSAKARTAKSTKSTRSKRAKSVPQTPAAEPVTPKTSDEKVQNLLDEIVKPSEQAASLPGIKSIVPGRFSKFTRILGEALGDDLGKRIHHKSLRYLVLEQGHDEWDVVKTKKELAALPDMPASGKLGSFDSGQIKLFGDRVVLAIPAARLKNMKPFAHRAFKTALKDA
jgi:hypothetical protein